MRSVPDEPQINDNPACVDGQKVKICKTNPVVEVIVDISHFLLAINSSANVIIYALRGKFHIDIKEIQVAGQCMSRFFIGSDGLTDSTILEGIW